MPTGKFDVLVTYDVSTTSAAGRRRLRKAAQVCLAFGQRVQNSVFECEVTEAQFEQLEARLLTVISEEEDRLRLYRLLGRRDDYTRAYGQGPLFDLHEPLIV
jgi:CRISPR-associated protein Cas2